MITRLRRPATVLAAAVLAVVAVGGPAVAAPDLAGRDSTAADPSSQLVVPGSDEKAAPFTSLRPTGPRALPGSEHTTGSALKPAEAAAAGPRLVPADGAATARPRPSSVERGAAAQSFACDEFIDRDVRVDSDESGAQVLQVDYYGDVLCNFFLIEASGVAGVIDRTPGHDGQVLDQGNPFHFQWDFYGFSVGDYETANDIYDGARRIEIAVEVFLLSEVPWGACNPLPGLRYLACDGLGTNLLHVVVGTGPFETGLQDPLPLFIGAGQGPGCRVTASHTLAPSRDAEGQHLAEVGFTGGIACSTGITGTSRARLAEVDANGNRGNDLKVGGESGANGQSTGSVSLRERDPGDRRVQVVYTGRTEAPPGRTWSCFGTPDADNYIFTQCSVTGNVVTWEAVGPLNGGRADQLFVDTGIPPFRDCRSAIEVLRVVNSELEVTGVASCNEAIESINVSVKVTGTYTENGVVKTVSLPMSGTADGDDADNNGRAEAEFLADCQPFRHTVAYDISVTARFEHPEGWRPLVFLPDPLADPIVLSEPCAPAGTG